MPTTQRPTETDRERTEARIGGELFAGEIVERGFDGEPVVYIRDHRDRTRAVRPQRPRHELDDEVTR